MSEGTVKVRYSCARCGISNAEVELRVREPNEGVVAWMRNVVETGLGADHYRRSPHCRTRTLSQIKIPILPGSVHIGGPAVH